MRGTSIVRCRTCEAHLNLSGVYQAVLPIMLSAPARIVNVSSGVAALPMDLVGHAHTTRSSSLL
jgi:short-subunit dehydrogenase involved in D-alanine esterification of teichoic acids